jgi:hypothetical protein
MAPEPADLDREMPKPAACIRAILRLIDSAYTVLTAPALEGMSEYTVAAGVAVGLVDGARRELAILGGER